MEFAGYDAWRTTDPADTALGRSDNRPTPYRCLDCAWRGRGAIAQAGHYRDTGHHTVWAHDPRPLFVAPKQLVTVCAWHADAAEQTASARAHGFDVSHTICDDCRKIFEAGE